LKQKHHYHGGNNASLSRGHGSDPRQLAISPCELWLPALEVFYIYVCIPQTKFGSPRTGLGVIASSLCSVLHVHLFGSPADGS
jgi:hypothetical protein